VKYLAKLSTRNTLISASTTNELSLPTSISPQTMTMAVATPVFTTVEELQEAAYNDIIISKWKAYIEWVDAERATGCLVAGVYYLTCENVDRYFLAVVVNMTAGQAMVCKELLALQ
jgi:hypothetical protein